MSDLTISKLQVADAADVDALLSNDSVAYQKHFVPFASDEVIADVLQRAQRDQFWGIRLDGRLVALSMLRGLDDGYPMPSFGVYVAQAFAAKGIGTLALKLAITWCRLNDCRDIRLSVHPENVFAVRLYEEQGFKFTGEISRRGHHVYRMRLL